MRASTTRILAGAAILAAAAALVALYRRDVAACRRFREPMAEDDDDRVDWECPDGKVWGKNGRCCASREDRRACVPPVPTADLIARLSGVERRQVDNPAAYGTDCVESRRSKWANRDQPAYSASVCSNEGRKKNVCLRGGDDEVWCAGPDDQGGIGWRKVLGNAFEDAIVDRYARQVGRYGCPMGTDEWETCCARDGKCLHDKVWMGRGPAPTPTPTPTPTPAPSRNRNR